MMQGEDVVDVSALVMTQSWSRKRTIVWSRPKDALAWQSCHLACFERLGGVTAVMRIDNVKTALSKGAGAWGEINPPNRRFASQMHFHVDACQVRQPRAKGKVERSVRDCREYIQRRTAEGKSPREIRQCLKRYIAREIYQHLGTGKPASPSLKGT
jgi:transposase